MPIRPLSKTLQDVAIEELNEVPDEIPEKLQHLHEWINKQPHLKCRSEDQWLLTFLRGCKFNMQKAKEKFENYYSARSTYPEFYCNRDPFAPEAEEYFKRCFFIRYSAPAGEKLSQPLVTLVRVNDYNADQIPFNTAFKLLLMLAELDLYTDDRYAILGEEIIIDLKGLNASTLSVITPSNVKRSTECGLKSYPTRIRNVCYINSPPIFSTAFNLIKTFLPEKMRKRVHIFSTENTNKLYNIIPKSMLPQEYGGDAGPLKEISAKLYDRLKMHNEWFIEEGHYGINENKRTPSLIESDLYGVDGSFRQLNID